MQITTVDVVSVNGKITRGKDGDAREWSSDEDWDHFQSIVAQHNLLVMGSRTYEMVRPEPQTERLRVVLTSRPQDYKHLEKPGQLEFLSRTPRELVKLMEARGYQRMLLLGGQVNRSFMADGLVSEMHVTIEPYVFGSGRNLLESGDFVMSLKLVSAKQVNERGTMVLHYLVDNSPVDALS